MNVSLTTELDVFVADLVKSGRYGSASEVVRAGLRLLQEHEARYQGLRAAIDEGLDSGPAAQADFKDIREQARGRRNARIAGSQAAE